MPERFRPLRRSDNEPTIFAPSPFVNPKLQEPLHQRYESGKPRYFAQEQKIIALERQGYACPICGQGISLRGSEGHHCVQHHMGGSASLDNLVVVHGGACHAEADRRAIDGDLIVGGTIYDVESTQVSDEYRWWMATH